jgi:hypothetical protein
MTTRSQAWPYMKLYHSYLDDIRLSRLPEPTQLRYFQLYMLAFRSDANGDLTDPDTKEPFTAFDIAYLVRKGEKIVKKDLELLAVASLLNYDGRCWRISRYTVEQENQAVQREKWRKAKADQRNGNESNGNKGSSNQSKGKSPNDVSQESHETFDDDNNSSQPKSENQGRENDNDIRDCLDMVEEILPAVPLSPGLKNSFREALSNGLDQSTIFQKIEDSRDRAEVNQAGYLITALKNAYPVEPTYYTVTEATKAVRSRLYKERGPNFKLSEGEALRSVNEKLHEQNIKPVTPEKYAEWNIEYLQKEAAE